MQLEKLVRDNIPNLPLKDGKPQRFRRATKEELPQLLADKLLEEAQEAAESINDKDKLTEELADVMEVLAAIGGTMGIKFADVIAVQKAKREKKGGFKEGFILLPPDPPKLTDPCDQTLGDWG